MAGPGRPAPGRAASTEVRRARLVGRPAQRHSPPSSASLRSPRLMTTRVGHRWFWWPQPKPFDYPHPDWDDSIQLIGSCSYDPAPSTEPEWLAYIDRPIVLVSTSSEDQDDSQIARVALAALAEEPVHVVATFPAGVPADLTAPANATVCQFVPHSVVLGRAACAITHGGMGVTQKALSRGVPVCVVPYGRDQFEVARRVEVAKCGTWLLPRDLTADRMRDEVSEGHDDDEGANRVAAGYGRHRWRDPRRLPHRTTVAFLSATHPTALRVNRSILPNSSHDSPGDLMTLPSVLLIPGAWHKPSHFRLLVDELADIDVHTVTLTSSGDDPATPAGHAFRRRDDRASSRGHRPAGRRVAHSYGGLPATQGLANAHNVRHLVFLASFQMNVGDSLLSKNPGGELLPWAQPAPSGGSRRLRRSHGRPRRCSSTISMQRPQRPQSANSANQSYASMRQPLTETAWKTIPTTYVICEDGQRSSRLRAGS